MNFVGSYSSFISLLLLAYAILSSSSDGNNLEDFLHCISLHSSTNDSNSILIHTPSSPSYSSILNFNIRNPRFWGSDTHKPVAIITPSQASHVQASVICCKNHGFQIRTRSGGHDFEGLSYVSSVPFVLIDLINLNSVTVDTKDSTAWVQSGATIGELYYRIGEKTKTLGFPGAVVPNVGVGGFLSGGGFGPMVRKYGLAADNVVDAYFVDANGKLHDRKSMGDDLFWAIRGGGGGSFGIVLAWKLKLVPVPAIVTCIAINKTWDQSVAKLVHQWQYVAPEADENLFISVTVTARNSSEGGGRMMRALFFSLFLGKAEELLYIMEKSFPELGLKKEDCIETSWIESTAILSIASGFVSGELSEVLVKKPPLNSRRYKVKSDFATEPIPETAMEGIWERFKIIGGIETVKLILNPHGGKMNEISETKTPSPYRAGYPIKIFYYVLWEQPDADARHLGWTRELYNYMTPFVSKSPRAVYANCRDLDIGRNNEEGISTSYEEASVWGLKYFGNNFEKLVEVKTKVDPLNFFFHEQSIPPAARRGIQAKVSLCPDVFDL
ncbi:berberine bridge enzyme-like 27 [Momordica charantia]|uniref:Berberine bridge enzyme-like 27 n=1 Tax=Momordica charantia TaxID=3673 RepID=A0A6J1DHA5_MOMCH|nr:berberine bridge enzyme-like 27 [Momordica charantia]